MDVNYADVTREGAHWPVSPPKESIKVKQLVSFSFRWCRYGDNGSYQRPHQHLNTSSASQLKLPKPQIDEEELSSLLQQRLQPKIRHSNDGSWRLQQKILFLVLDLLLLRLFTLGCGRTVSISAVCAASCG